MRQFHSFFALLPLMLLSLPGLAQNLGFQEVHGNLGFFSIKDATANTDTAHYSESPWNSQQASPIISAGLLFYEKGMLSLGLDAGFQQLTYPDEYLIQDDQGNSLLLKEDIKASVFSLSPRLQLNWMTTADDKFRLYSNFNLGLSIFHEKHLERDYLDETYPLPTAHLSILGMRFGHRLAGFFEIGAGYRGIINAGISYRP